MIKTYIMVNTKKVPTNFSFLNKLATLSIMILYFLLNNTTAYATEVILKPGVTIYTYNIANQLNSKTVMRFNNKIVTGAISNYMSDVEKQDCNAWNAQFGWSSDNKYWGIKVAEDVIVSINGMVRSSLTFRQGSTNYGRGGGFLSDPKKAGVTFIDSAETSSSSLIYCAYITLPSNATPNSGESYPNISNPGELSIYAGPNAPSQSIPVEIYYGVSISPAGFTQSLWSGTITVKARECTVSTDNTITFPPVDVSDAQNNQALANKTGNLTVNCDDESNTPVTVEIQGPKGRYTDTMALTMKDGSDAPAEIRGFIGTDIPLTGQCNGRLDGYPGIVYFIPNAGLEKITLTPGANKYNWVLCSNGQNKTGQATGSAKLILNWD